MKKIRKNYLIVDQETKEVYTPEEFAALKGIKRIKTKLAEAFADNAAKTVRVPSNHPCFNRQPRKPFAGGRPAMALRMIYVTPAGPVYTRTEPAEWSIVIDVQGKKFRRKGEPQFHAMEWEKGVFHGRQEKAKPTADVLL